MTTNDFLMTHITYNFLKVSRVLLLTGNTKREQRRTEVKRINLWVSPSWHWSVDRSGSSWQSGDWEGRWCWSARSCRTWWVPRTWWTPWFLSARSCPDLSGQRRPRTMSVLSPTNWEKYLNWLQSWTRIENFSFRDLFSLDFRRLQSLKGIDREIEILLGEFSKSKAMIYFYDDLVILLISHL